MLNENLETEIIDILSFKLWGGKMDYSSHDPTNNKLIIDILDILEHKLKGSKIINIFHSNLEFFEEILGKKAVLKFKNDVVYIELKEISSKEKIALQKYLDYLYMIEDRK